MAKLLNQLNDSIHNISEESGIPINDKDIQLKLNFHSPGMLELIGIGSQGIICISVLTFALNNLINGGTSKIGISKKDSQFDFTLESNTDGIKGANRKDKELELKEKETYAKLIKDLDIKSNPELFASIINGEKIDSKSVKMNSKKSSSKHK